MRQAKAMRRPGVMLVTALAAVTVLAACARRPEPPRQPGFQTPEEAVRALSTAVASGKLNEVVAIFGPDGQALVDSSDPLTARRNREVFTAAMAEGWRLVAEGTQRVLVIGHEAWPFPVPLVQDAGGWRFDTAAGRDEVTTRRIGRNELAAIQVSRTYVIAQRLYARRGHDGKPAGVYAATFRSDPGKQNGLYWPAVRGEKRSPLGELVTQATGESASPAPDRAQPSPFHGYYFRILSAQGAAADGGAKGYVVGGAMSGGFALVAWPAQYDVTGVMSFIVNHEGIVYEKDLGPDPDTLARQMMLYDPDASWSPVE
jgi:hypothetical protein